MADASYPTPDEIHAQLLSDLRYGYARLGITVNVKRDSDLWHRTRAVANRVSIAVANGKAELAKVNPLKASGTPLEDFAKLWGVTKRPATKALGFVIVTVLSPVTSVTIPSGFKGTSATGVKYQTVSTTTASTGGLVKVEAVDTGARTNLAADAVVTWDSSALGFLDLKAKVAAGGLEGGADKDDDEALRSRLLRRLSFPAVGGNWSQVAELADKASAAVEFVAVYPAVRGPASYDVAIVGKATDPVLNNEVVNQVAAAVGAQMPGSSHLNVTSITKEEIDVIINCSLPLPVQAGGVGGGWLDNAPWPSTAETGSNVFAEVTAVSTTNKTITVNSTSADAPVAGGRFSLWDYKNRKFRGFSIQSVAGSSGAYVLTLDVATSSDMSFLETGMYCSPQAVQLQTYADLFVAAMGLLGPGEKTTNADILVWGRRKPGVDLERPHALTSRALQAISSVRSEVSDLSFAGRFATGTKTTRTAPSVPSSTAGAPRLLYLKHLAFRRQV